MLSERQELILKLVIDDYLASGRPVASKTIADRSEVECGPSTVRYELAALEAAGYLTHPHTSAGRVPTEIGYRYHVDRMMQSGEVPGDGGVELRLSRLRREIDEAMRETTAALAQVNDLMALATAPAASLAATIHRVEVLRLQPTKVMVIAIASTGAVAKRVFDFEARVDPGLVEWASSYLNESLAGMDVGARMIADRLADPELGSVEAAFIGTLSAAFTELEREAGDTLYTDGASRLLSDAHFDDLPRADRADDGAGAARGRAGDVALRSRSALGVPLDRRREPAAGAALGERRRRQLRPGPSQPRVGRRRGAAAHGLRDGDLLGPGRRPRAVPLLRVGLRRLS